MGASICCLCTALWQPSSLLPMLWDGSALPHRIMSPSSGCLHSCFCLTVLYSLWLNANSRLQLWGRNDGLVANVANSLQLLFGTESASSNSISAHASRKAISSHNLALFQNVWVYVWTCIHTCTHNGKKIPLSPLVPLCLSNFLSCWCTSSRDAPGACLSVSTVKVRDGLGGQFTAWIIGCQRREGGSTGRASIAPQELLPSCSSCFGSFQLSWHSVQEK